MIGRRGHLIVFSGLDGAGKSTQTALLIEQLQGHGRRPVYLWTRGGYTPAFDAAKRAIRRLFRGRIVPSAGHSEQRTRAFRRAGVRRLWLWLALLDLIWVYGFRIRWWLWRGRVVVADRYLWDTLIDFRLNLGEAVESWLLWRLLLRLAPRPDASFLLLIPVSKAVRRSAEKSEPFPDSPAVLAQRLAYYESLEEESLHVMDGRRPIAELGAEIRVQLEQIGLTIRSTTRGERMVEA
jgi:dTMP kinase